MVRRGDIEVAKPGQKISQLLKRGGMKIPDPGQAKVYGRFLAELGAHEFGKIQDSTIVPDVSAVEVFRTRLDTADQAAAAQHGRAVAAEHAVDHEVFEWYAVPQAWRPELARGFPWASGTQGM